MIIIEGLGRPCLVHYNCIIVSFFMSPSLTKLRRKALGSSNERLFVVFFTSGTINHKSLRGA